MLGLDRPPAADAEGSSAMARGAAAAAAGGAGDSDEEEAKEQVNAQDAAAVTRRPQRPAPPRSRHASSWLDPIYIYMYIIVNYSIPRELLSPRDGLRKLRRLPSERLRALWG
jgi:hypothetical protein